MLQENIEELWERKHELTPNSAAEKKIIFEVIKKLDEGEIRVVDPETLYTIPFVNEWVKKAILMWFLVNEIETISDGIFEFRDKLPLKKDYANGPIRVVPMASARFGSHLEKNVVMMPSYINIGAYVGEETMVDTWATVGSCAQIGKRVHLSGGVGIGGVLEPPQAKPVIVGDDAYIGSRSMIVEGARVGIGAVVGAGVILSGTIPVIDAATGEELGRGDIPPWCVAVGASREKRFNGGTFYLPCVLVIKRLVEGKRHDKTELESVLREFGITK